MPRFLRIPAFLVLMLGPEVAAAQSSPPPNREQMLQQAQTLVNQASEAFKDKDFARALTALRKAEPLAAQADDPSLPRIRFNIARCLEELGQWDDAMAAYEKYNELPDASHRKERAFEAIQQLRGRVFATLSVACVPAGSLVEIAGVTKGKESCPWKSDQVKPGAYAVKISHPGHESQVKTVDVSAGKSFTVEATLKSNLPPQTIFVDVDQGEPINYWPLLTMGAGVIVAGTGGFFTSSAIDDRDEVELLPPGEERDSFQDDFELNRNLSYVMYGTGGAIVLGGFVWWLIDYLDEDDDLEDGGTAFDVRPGPNGIQVRF